MVLIILVIGAFVLNLTVGNAKLSLAQVFDDELTKKLIFDYRLPKAIAALLAGVSLSVSGFLLQELFRNPLADPSVLGITSASGLGVASVIFLSAAAGFFPLVTNSWFLCLASFLGALIATLLLLYFSSKLNSTTALIIIGMMIAGFTSAIISLMQFFAPSDQIKTYLLWTFGSISGLSWEQVFVFCTVVLFGLILSVFTMRGISGLRLGENYAQTMGINVKQIRWLILISSSLLTAATTAFVGPIAFVGLAVPHICRLIFKENEIGKLFVLVVLVGAFLLLIFAWIAQSFPSGSLPINIITSLIGTPIVISIIWKQRKHYWNV